MCGCNGEWGDAWDDGGHGCHGVRSRFLQCRSNPPGVAEFEKPLLRRTRDVVGSVLQRLPSRRHGERCTADCARRGSLLLHALRCYR